jgi:hypothetical protein
MWECELEWEVNGGLGVKGDEPKDLTDSMIHLTNPGPGVA